MLQAIDLAVNYAGHRALSEVTLGIAGTELVSVIGSNGAGKSSLLKALCGLHRPSSGRIVFDGTDITRLRADQIARRGLICVPEGHRVVTRQSVETNLRLGAYTNRDRTTRTQTRDTVFDLFPILRERLHQRAGTLSGGEQQMLALGRALMSRPKLLLLDEPTVGVAPQVVEVIFESIKAILSSGVAVLLVEQKIEAALAMSDRVYLLQTGKVVVAGTPDEVRKSPHLHSSYLGI